MLPESLVAARKLLEEITPLQTDCGLVCGGACCQTHPGEETGMLLFPGEAEMYRGEKGFTLVDSPHGTILVCEGRCSRANRPLACRMFPLVMLLRPDGVKSRRMRLRNRSARWHGRGKAPFRRILSRQCVRRRICLRRTINRRRICGV